MAWTAIVLFLIVVVQSIVFIQEGKRSKKVIKLTLHYMFSVGCLYLVYNDLADGNSTKFMVIWISIWLLRWSAESALEGIKEITDEKAV